MVLVDSTGNTHNGSSCILIPVRCTQACKCRYHITAVGIRYFLSHVLRIRGRIDDLQFIPQPLNRSSRYKNRTLQCIIHFSIQAPCNGSNQSIIGKYRFFACIHQHETAGSIRIFCLTGLETGLPEQCRLLVPCRTCDGDLSTQKRRICLAINTAGRLCLRKHARRNIQLFQDFFIPLKGIDIEQHSSGCVGIIRHMNSTFGQLPDQPGLHRTKQ